jgi:hypothetical protein
LKEWFTNKKKSWNLLSSKPNTRTEPKRTQKEAENFLKEALLAMDNYDFMVSTKEIPRKIKPMRSFRVVYLNFTCHFC